MGMMKQIAIRLMDEYSTRIYGKDYFELTPNQQKLVDKRVQNTPLRKAIPATTYHVTNGK